MYLHAELVGVSLDFLYKAFVFVLDRCRFRVRGRTCAYRGT